MAVGPPLHISAARLFRLLLRTPRASWPVSIPIAGAPRGAFRVFALDSHDEADCYDAVAALPIELRRGRLGAELAAACLCDESGARVFASAGEMLQLLDAREARAVIAAVDGARTVVAPSVRWIDYGAWRLRLIEGAEEEPTFAIPLAECVDGHIIRGAPRPDRYFGVPMARVNDGQWLCYRAARFAYVEKNL